MAFPSVVHIDEAAYTWDVAWRRRLLLELAAFLYCVSISHHHLRAAVHHLHLSSVLVAPDQRQEHC